MQCGRNKIAARNYAREPKELTATHSLQRIVTSPEQSAATHHHFELNRPLWYGMLDVGDLKLMSNVVTRPDEMFAWLAWY
jgi:hypothetical protein